MNRLLFLPNDKLYLVTRDDSSSCNTEVRVFMRHNIITTCHFTACGVAPLLDRMVVQFTNGCTTKYTHSEWYNLIKDE